MTLSPSKEQQEIVNHIKNHNVIVDSTAGSGKTTVIQFIAEVYTNLEILVLTYNAQLKNETRKRLGNYPNVDVHSYHSFCVANYDKNAYTDDKINYIVQNDTKCTINYDIIIADESQDITPLLYKLLCKILIDNAKKANIMIMGDQMQSIYKFREADPRFITFSDKIFNKFNDLEWVNCTLSQTFRCTIPMVDFINECMIGYKRMISTKASKNKPDYIICNSYGYPCSIIKDYLSIYKPQDIFVVAFSIKDRTPIKHLANYVTNNLDVPIYCSNSDQESLDSRVIENKLVFSSIHQIKGRERKAVIFIGFDDSYFEYYDKNADKTICPNELYVAVTRGSERLTIIHDSKRKYLPFLAVEKLRKYTNFTTKQTKENPPGRSLSVASVDSFNVSDLVSYLPFSVENICMNYLKFKVLSPGGPKLAIPSVIKSQSGNLEIYENVSDITGIAIPAHFEYKRLGKSTLFSKNLVEKKIMELEKDGLEGSKRRLAMITKLKKFSKTLGDFHKAHIEKIDPLNINVSDLLKISLYYSAQQSKNDYKLKQINNFTWLSSDMLEEGKNRLSNIVKGKDLVFEESVEENVGLIKIIGEIDCICKDYKTVYEFKCTNDLNISHMIQLGIYMYLYWREDYKYVLFNIFTGEVREISGSYLDLQEMIKILIEHKMSGLMNKSDDDFLKEFCNLTVD